MEAATARFPNYLFSLLSWEETSCLFQFMREPEPERRRLAQATGFRQFALGRGVPPAAAAAIPAAAAAAGGHGGTTGSGSGGNSSRAAGAAGAAALEAYWAFCNHVWRGLLATGRSVMPRLTLEVGDARLGCGRLGLGLGWGWAVHDMMMLSGKARENASRPACRAPLAGSRASHTSGRGPVCSCAHESQAHLPLSWAHCAPALLPCRR